MKNMQVIGFLTILIIGFLLISGCTQDNNKYCSDNFPGTYYDPSSKMCEHSPTPTPQIIYVTVTVTPTPPPSTTIQPTINPTAKATSIYEVGDKIYINQPGDVISRYRVGDIIWETNNPYRRDLDGSMCLVIYAVDSINKKYTTDFVWRDTGTTRWYREYPSLEYDSIIMIDRDYPYLIDHIDISKLSTKYSSEAAYNAANR